MRPFESWADIEAMAAALGPRHGPVVIFAAATGMRPGEWIALERRDIDRDARVAYVRRAFTDGRLKCTKTDASVRAVPLQAVALAALDRLPTSKATPLLFPSPHEGVSPWSGVRLLRLRYPVHMTALTAEDRDRARTALRALGAHPRITTEDGTVLDLPAPVADALAEVLKAAADGVSALVLRSPEDLTTEQAAAVLGVSRPTVVRLVESGTIPARMVGSHRRLSLGDVLAHREASARRRTRALDDMAHEAEELSLYD